MDKAMADVAKKAKIPGFRPGKAPKAIVEKHYGDEVRSEVMHRLVTESYIQALQENNLNPVDVPQIEQCLAAGQRHRRSPLRPRSKSGRTSSLAPMTASK